MSKNRKSIRAKIRGELQNLNTEVDLRSSQYLRNKNRYELQLDQKRTEKRLRDQRKNAKFHIGQRRNLRKRWEMEGTLMEYYE